MNDLRAPFSAAATLTLCRVALQADLDGKLRHISIGYLTQAPSSTPALYRERWLPDLDGHAAMNGMLEHLVAPAVRSHESDFVDARVSVLAVFVDIGDSIRVVYSIEACGHVLERVVKLTLQRDSFHARALSRLISELETRLAA